MSSRSPQRSRSNSARRATKTHANEKVLRQAVKEFNELHQRELVQRDVMGDAKNYRTSNYQIAKAEAGETVSREEFEEQRKVLAALAETSKHLTVETNIISILERIAESVVTSLGVQKANFWDFTTDKKKTFIMAAYGMQQQYIDNSRNNPMPLGKGWIGRAMSTGQAWGTSDVQTDPLLPKSWLPAAKEQDYHGLLCMPLKQGNEVIGGFCIYHQDIHEWKFFEYEVMTIVANQAATALTNARTFRNLEAERQKTQSIIDSLHDGLVMYNTKDEIVFLNPKANKLLELTELDLRGINLTESYIKKHPHRRLTNLLTIKELDQAYYQTKTLELTTSEAIVLEITRIPVNNERGEVVGTLQILHDITEEHEVELMKSNFVSVASHQIRTPLTGVRWTIDTLKSQSVGSLNEQQLTKLEKISVVTEHFTKLINDLLDVSRLDEGRMDFVFTTASIKPTLTEVLTLLEPFAEKRTISLSTKLPKRLPSLTMDPSKISIALQNVIDNAIKYSPEKTGKISITVSATKTELQIEIKDNGIGVPEHQQSFLFNKFFRADNAVRVVTTGSGLGLYLTKQIIDRHNGTITFTSKEDRGTTFFITLPL